MSYADAERSVLEQLGAAGVNTLLGRELREASASRLHMGSMYVFLSRMEDRELIDGFAAGTDGRRYQITARGRLQLARYRDPLPKALALPRGHR